MVIKSSVTTYNCHGILLRLVIVKLYLSEVTMARWVSQATLFKLEGVMGSKPGQDNGMLHHSLGREVIFFLWSTLMLLPSI